MTMTPSFLQTGVGRKSLAWVAVAGVVGCGLLGTQRLRAKAAAHPNRVYVAEGFGGYAPLPVALVAPSVESEADPLRELKALYWAGQWAQAETLAGALREQKQHSGNAAERRQAVQAWLWAGYASAWRKDYLTAGERFLQTQSMAAELPDHGARKPQPNQAQASLEEEAAFQHAVCVGALGNQTAAEDEYNDFLRRYPLSVLVHGAVKRVARLHGGNVPPDSDRLWKQAMHSQAARDKRQQRERSLCGPQCVAELLHRQGKPADVHTLANEMHANENGTNLLSLVTVARRHGLDARGVEISRAGLATQKLPLVTLLKPGHYVVVEAVTTAGVTVWDGDAKGAGQAGRKTYTPAQWQPFWTGKGMEW